MGCRSTLITKNSFTCLPVPHIIYTAGGEGGAAKRPVTLLFSVFPFDSIHPVREVALPAFCFFPLSRRTVAHSGRLCGVVASQHCLNSCVPSAFLKGVCVWPVTALISLSRPAFTVNSPPACGSKWISLLSPDLSELCEGNKADTGSVDTVTDMSSGHNHGLMRSALPVPETQTTLALIFIS